MVFTGVRIAVVNAIGSAVFAAFVGGGGLGSVINRGIRISNMGMILSATGALMVIAVLLDLAMGWFEGHLKKMHGVSRRSGIILACLMAAVAISIPFGLRDTTDAKELILYDGDYSETQIMTSVGSLALYDTICAAQLADTISSLDFEALTGLRNAFDPRIHAVRGQKGQMLVAANMRKLLAGSEILDNCQKDRVQDAYALRCIPQLHGAVRDALEYVRSKVEIELNAVTDNPLLFLDDEAVISGGNFHGEPMPSLDMSVYTKVLSPNSSNSLERSSTL